MKTGTVDALRSVQTTLARSGIAHAARVTMSRSAILLWGMLGWLFMADPSGVLAQRAFDDLPSDPVLDGLVHETLAALPELRGARDSVRAEAERVPQAGALPDPVLTLGIQNDGFKSIEIGKAETSWWRVELNQSLPWPGKRDLRTDSAKLSVERAEAYVERLRLSAEASVRRAYVDLLLVRARLALLRELEAVWLKSAELARARYQAGLGAQSDVYRAELERFRLRQRRFALVGEERRAIQTLNRLRGHHLDEPIATMTRIEDLSVPGGLDLEPAVADARARSPELKAARLGVSQARKQVELAGRERYPDMSVGAGIMPRGSMPPMWSANVSIGLPVWSHRKQSRAVAESSARASAETQSEAAVAQTVSLQAAERVAALAAVLDTIRVYREGLLAQSEATVESTLAQYQVGRVTFASVLDANVGYLNDREGLLLAVTQAQRIAIADAEVALEVTDLGPSAGGGMGAGAVPGQGTLTPSIGSMGGQSTSSAPASASGATASPGM